MPTIKMVAGLGNPGPEYAKTRHNAGIWCLNAMANRLDANWSLERRFSAKVATVQLPVSGGKLWLLEPQTWMNQSGQPVSALARFYRIAAEEILIIHDELDIAPGDIRLKQGGGHAGHNGLRDIHAQLGTNNYWRLRVGIGHPGHSSQVVSWVLGQPSTDHWCAIQQAIDHSLTVLSLILTGDISKARTLLHTRHSPS